MQRCPSFRRTTTLTPRDDGYDREMEVAKHDDELVEHEDGLCSHPRHRGHGEVVYEEGEHRAADLVLHATNPDQEEEEHEEHCDAQLNVELAGFLLSYFTA